MTYAIYHTSFAYIAYPECYITFQLPKCYIAPPVMPDEHDMNLFEQSQLWIYIKSHNIWIPDLKLYMNSFMNSSMNSYMWKTSWKIWWIHDTVNFGMNSIPAALRTQAAAQCLMVFCRCSRATCLIVSRSPADKRTVRLAELQCQYLPPDLITHLVLAATRAPTWIS